MTQLYKEYARALFVLSLEEGKTDEYASDLKIIEDALDTNPGFSDLLTSPAIKLSERLDMIDKVFSQSVSRYVLSFIKLMCEKKRLVCLKECIEEYRGLREEFKKISFVKVVSAVELSEDEKNRLVSKLEKTSGKNVNAEFVVDQSILGGIIVETDGKILDGSLKYKLKDVKEGMSR